MFLAFVLWGVSEGSVNESVCCSALFFLRPLLILWAAPYMNMKFTGKIKTWILKYSYIAEYVVFSIVVYSALFSIAWQKLLNYAEFDRVVIIVLFSIVFLGCLCKIIYILVTQIGQKSGWIIQIFGLVADISIDILPTLQFIIMFYTFGSGGAGFIIIILPVFMMMNNETWFHRCKERFGCSESVIRPVMLIFILVMNAVIFGLYIMTLEKTTDPLGWGCVLMFLQIIWTVMKFTDDTSYYFSFSRDFHRYVVVYVYGSVVVVFLTSTVLITELILKKVNGDRTVGDLRFIVFLFECVFAVSLLFSGLFESRLTVHGPSAPLVAPLGSSVVLSCYVDKPLPMEGLEVQWRRTDSETDSVTVVHLFLNGESRPEIQQQDYQDRAHFFTDQIQHGNFSLRLDNLRAEDEGKYTCKVYSDQDSGETEVQIKDVERLLVSGSSRSISASVGEDVTLNCSVDSHITPEHIEELSWKKTDEDDIPVMLYQNNKTLPEAAHERYRDRVEFFTDEIPKGNFSLRLKGVRTEDKGVYMCQVFAGHLSANATVELEQLGFSALHIMVLILCISASGSALLLCCLIYCRSPDKGIIQPFVPLGSSVILTCCVDKHLSKKNLKVEWRKTNSEKENALHSTYQIQHGNVSLKLENLSTEDNGEYTCRVYKQQDCVFSTKFILELGK
ncbi:uncharacterized protein [Pseudorasbora parva]|uniref:uncharacterized protein n=1 Tax=Pseudorasbora parva TaxID=51549 RepID=UPI00351EC4B6